jgi:hypothetical protein
MKGTDCPRMSETTQRCFSVGGILAYTDIIRRLPSPTETRKEQYASYVSETHGWYQHLPLYPLTSFTFFLDPNAGRQMVHSKEDGEIPRDITEESDRFHCATNTTAEYCAIARIEH